MKKQELKKLSFENAVEKLRQEKDNITTYETLKQFSIDNIENDNLFLAIHILQGINDEQADYYDYDYCMGTLETPTPIKTKDDLIDYLE